MKLNKILLIGGGLTLIYILSGVLLLKYSSSTLAMIFYLPFIIPMSLGYDGKSDFLIYIVGLIVLIFIWMVFSAFVYAIANRINNE